MRFSTWPSALRATAIVFAVLGILGLTLGGLLVVYMYSAAKSFNPQLSRQMPNANPHPAITFINAGTESFNWKVDNSFEISFDKRFVVNENTKLGDLPQGWKIRDNDSPMGGLVVVDDESGVEVFLATVTPQHQIILELSVDYTDPRHHIIITDRRTGRTFEINGAPATEEALQEFFRNAPR